MARFVTRANGHPHTCDRGNVGAKLQLATWHQFESISTPMREEFAGRLGLCTLRRRGLTRVYSKHSCGSTMSRFRFSRHTDVAVKSLQDWTFLDRATSACACCYTMRGGRKRGGGLPATL